MVPFRKTIAVIIIGLVIAAALTTGYFYFNQTHASSPSSQAPNPSASPTPSSSASPTPFSSTSPQSTASPTPMASILTPTQTPTVQPTVAPTPTPSPTPTPPGYYFSDLSINPDEAWPGTTITISAQVTNDQMTESTSASLQINGATLSSQTVQIPSGTSETITFNATETNTETYNVQVGTLTGSFDIVPNGEYTLSIYTAYSMEFTFDGQTELTPFSELVSVGTTHTIIMQTSVGGYAFLYWQDDGDTNATRTVTVTAPTYLTADYSNSRGGSCPSLYVWNGTGYSYVAEVNDGTGWLGYLEYFQPDGSMVFSYNYPYDYIKLDSTQLQPLNGFYNLKIAEMSDEIFYLDSVKMIAVDHPANVNVFSTASTFIYNLTGQGTIYTVSDNLATPVSAVNGTGQNVLPLISKLDGKFTTGTRWKWQSLTLNLGNLTGAKEINMVVAAKITWPTTQAGGENFLSYANQPGVTPSPPPYMQVKAANGSWVNVPDDREFPIPHVTDSEFDVNLTGLFPTNNYELKINYYQDIQFDYIGISTTPQQNIIVHTLTLSSADLEQAFSVNSNSSGAFTKYGDVTAAAAVCRRQVCHRTRRRRGFTAIFRRPTACSKRLGKRLLHHRQLLVQRRRLALRPVHGNPLPFQAMTSFPYPSNESYPYDADHLAYLQEYNTRIINP